MHLRKSAIKYLTLLILAASLGACGGAEARKAKYLERGKSYIAEENWEKAAVELKNVLQIDPKHAEAHYLMGEIEEKNKDGRRAAAYYAKAIELDPKHSKAQAKMAQIYIAQYSRQKMNGQKEEADKWLKEAHKSIAAILANDPKNTEGLTLTAILTAERGDPAKALTMAYDILKTHPDATDAARLAALIHIQQGDNDKARDVLNKAIQAAPKNVALRTTLVQLYARLGDKAGAERVLKEIVTIEPELASHRNNLALFYAQSGQADQAEKILRESIQQDAKDTQRYGALAEFMAATKGFDAARDELLAAIKANPDNDEIRFILAAFYQKTNRAADAEKVYREVIARAEDAPAGLMARTRLAELLLLQGKGEESDPLIADVLKQSPTDSNALQLQGRRALAKDKPQDAITAFRSFLKDQPDSVAILTLLAEAHRRNNEPELAMEALRKAADAKPGDPAGHLRLARYHAQLKEYDDGLAAVENALQAAPKDLQAMQLKAQILGAKNDKEGVGKVLESIKTAHPDSPAGNYAMGQYDLALQRFDEADREFDQALAKLNDPSKSLALLTGMVKAYLAQGKSDLAAQRMNALLKSTPAHPYAHGLLGIVRAAEKKWPEAETALNQAIKINPSWTAPYETLAQVYIQRNDLTAAERVLQQGLIAVPGDAQLSMVLAGVQEKAGQPQAAISTYEGLLKNNPQNSVARNNLAALLAEHGKDAASLQRARELAQPFAESTQPAFMDTLAWVYYKLDEADKALPLLQKVVEQAPKIPIFHYHLGMVYYKQGDAAQAKKHLSLALAEGADFSGAATAKETLSKLQ